MPIQERAMGVQYGDRFYVTFVEQDVGYIMDSKHIVPRLKFELDHTNNAVAIIQAERIHDLVACMNANPPVE